MKLRRRATVRVEQPPSVDDLREAESLQRFKSRVRRVFNDLDRNGDSVLHKEEVAVALKLMQLPASPQHIKTIFESCATNAQGQISYADFEAYALGRRQELAAVFYSLDQNSDGFVTEDDIRRALRKLNIKASDTQILKLMQRADLNNDGRVHFNEFQEFLLLCTSGSIENMFDYWAHASAIDIGESLTAPDNFQDHTDAVITFFAGAFAGVVSRTATAPMDRLKTLLQAGTERGTIVQGLKRIVQEGGWKGFWRGNGTNVIKIIPESAIRFMGYDFFKKAICKDVDAVTIGERFVAGALAGCTGQVAIYPLEIAKTRLAVSKTGEFAGIADCIAKTLKTGGVQGLYRGLGTSVLGVIPYAGVDLGIFYTLRAQWMTAHPGSAEGPDVITLLLFGAASSTCGQLCAYPFQLIRTKLQAQGLASVAEQPLMQHTAPQEHYFTGMTDCFRRTVQEQGIKGLYRGLGPNFLKALPAIAISYAVFEKSRVALTKVAADGREAWFNSSNSSSSTSSSGSTSSSSSSATR